MIQCRTAMPEGRAREPCPPARRVPLRARHRRRAGLQPSWRGDADAPVSLRHGASGAPRDAGAGIVMPVSSTPTLSICTTCRDGREDERDGIRGGARLADAICALAGRDGCAARLRGVRCMSQCKRACIVSLTAPGAFTYLFGDLDPEDPDHVRAILDLIPLYRAAPEGFLTRDARPEPLRAAILARLPPLGTASELVSDLGPMREVEA